MHGAGRMRGREQNIDPELKPDAILVGMNTAVYLEARRRQVQHGLLMALMLFLFGSGAIYFIFVVQNYRTIDRTLSNLTTYTSNIVDNMPNGLLVMDADGHPTMINHAARQMFDWGDRPARELAREPVVTALFKEFAPAVLKGETVLERDCDLPLAGDTHLPAAVSAASVPSGTTGEEGPGMIFILRDLSQIKALEARIRRSEKLAAVGRLAAGIAHEVRNPLSSMRGLARFLARSFDEKSRESEYLSVMVEEIDRLNRVINGLLDFARPRKPDLVPVDLNDTVRHTLELIKDDAAGQGVTLIHETTPDNPLIHSDRDQTIQAVLNVLLNALEAMPQGGRMTIRTDLRNGQATFEVQDTGSGIPDEIRAHLFDPFFTTKKKGTGLGLAQVASIMEGFGGRVEIGNAPGRGARIVLSFPLYSGQKLETP